MGANMTVELVLDSLDGRAQDDQHKTVFIIVTEALSMLLEYLDKYSKITKMICGTVRSAKGNCWDNAVAESFFHTLKTEWVYYHDYETREEAKQSLFKYIEAYYNRKKVTLR